jgi:hypothetical protein
VNLVWVWNKVFGSRFILGELLHLGVGIHEVLNRPRITLALNNLRHMQTQTFWGIHRAIGSEMYVGTQACLELNHRERLTVNVRR